MLDRHRAQQTAEDVQGSCTEHAEAVKLLSSYAKGVRQSLKARFVDINDLSLFDVLHPSRVPKPEEPTFDDFGVQGSEVCLKSTGRTSRKVVIAILHCFQTQLCPSMRCTRSWCGSVAGEAGGSLIKNCMR